jgi:hypothetical protein
LSGDDFNRFYKLFGKRSFRQATRQIVSKHGEPVLLSDLKGMAGEAATEYVEFLESLGVVKKVGDSVSLTRMVDNIGPTLEWYVAELCLRELAGSASWSVKLDDLPTGGDYDVISWLPPALVYVETKSSAPSQVSEAELMNFLQRGEELAADAAVLLVDTESDMSELLTRLNEAMIPTVRNMSGIHDDDWRPEKPTIGAQNTFPGIAWGMQRFYVTNAKPSIVQQLRRVLRHYNEIVKGASFWGGPPVNWVTKEVYDS